MTEIQKVTLNDILKSTVGLVADLKKKAAPILNEKAETAGDESEIDDIYDALDAISGIERSLQVFSSFDLSKAE